MDAGCRLAEPVRRRQFSQSHKVERRNLKDLARFYLRMFVIIIS